MGLPGTDLNLEQKIKKGKLKKKQTKKKTRMNK